MRSSCVDPVGIPLCCGDVDCETVDNAAVSNSHVDGWVSAEVSLVELDVLAKIEHLSMIILSESNSSLDDGESMESGC